VVHAPFVPPYCFTISLLLLLQTDEMTALFDSANPGLARRFPESYCRVTFAPYTRLELRSIFAKEARARNIAFDFSCADAASFALERESAMRNFGNASAAKAFAERLDKFLLARARATLASPASVVPGVSASAAVTTPPSLACAADIAALQNSERLASPLDGFVLCPELREFVDGWCRDIASSHALRQPAPDWPHLILSGYPVSVYVWMCGAAASSASSAPPVCLWMLLYLFVQGTGKTTSMRVAAVSIPCI
jgi:hypothetical protein